MIKSLNINRQGKNFEQKKRLFAQTSNIMQVKTQNRQSFQS